ncbi:hypothetical protein D3C87_1407130 [compost metagenome]
MEADVVERHLDDRQIRDALVRRRVGVLELTDGDDLGRQSADLRHVNSTVAHNPVEVDGVTLFFHLHVRAVESRVTLLQRTWVPHRLDADEARNELQVQACVHRVLDADHDLVLRVLLEGRARFDLLRGHVEQTLLLELGVHVLVDGFC